MYHWDPWFGGGFGWLGGLLAIVLFALLLAGLVRLFLWAITGHQRDVPPQWATGGSGAATPGATPGHSPNQPVQASAQEILRQRFARGEISEAEFQRMRDVLGPDPER